MTQAAKPPLNQGNDHSFNLNIKHYQIWEKMTF